MEPQQPADLDCFDRILKRVRDLPALRSAVVGAANASVLGGIVEAAEAGLVDPVLVGGRDAIDAAAEEAGIDVTAFPVISATSETAAAGAAVSLVQEGSVQGLVKGHVHTNAFMTPVIKHLRTDRRISHVFVLEMPSYHKLLSVTDAAVNIAPDLAAKVGITQNAIDLVRCFGIDEPKVAVLSAVEVINPAIPSSIDAACLSKMAERRQLKGALVDGPLAFDLAISAESAVSKRVVSPVSGDVDILVVPELDAGNILVKDLQHLAGATLAGLVVGASVPCVLTSRADPPRSRMLSCALAALVGADPSWQPLV